jgi:hypothetical protein
MILAPDLSIAMVASNDGKHYSLLVRRRDDSKVMGSLHIDLASIEREGFHSLCQRVGHAAVYALARAHPEVFAKHPLLPPPPSHTNPHEMTNWLLYCAERDETGNYTAALDALFRRYPEELAGLAELWARLRSTLPAADLQ